MSKYFRLTDKKNKDTIVKAEGRIQHQFIPGSGWVRSGILLEYQWPESPLYGYYETIPESEALKAIN